MTFYHLLCCSLHCSLTLVVFLESGSNFPFQRNVFWKCFFFQMLRRMFMWKLICFLATAHTELLKNCFWVQLQHHVCFRRSNCCEDAFRMHQIWNVLLICVFRVRHFNPNPYNCGAFQHVITVVINWLDYSGIFLKKMSTWKNVISTIMPNVPNDCHTTIIFCFCEFLCFTIIFF